MDKGEIRCLACQQKIVKQHRKANSMNSATKVALELWAKSKGYRRINNARPSNNYYDYCDSNENLHTGPIIDLDFCIEVSKLVDVDKYLKALMEMVLESGDYHWMKIHNATISQRLSAIERAAE